MMKDASHPPKKGFRILGAFTEFRDALQEGGRIEKRYTFRTVELDLYPKPLGPQQIKQARNVLGLSQPLFARFLGVVVKTFRAWEQGLRTPSPWPVVSWVRSPARPTTGRSGSAGCSYRGGPSA